MCRRVGENGGPVSVEEASCARAGAVGSAAITTIEANPQLLPSMRQTHSLNGVVATAINAIVVAKKESEKIPFYIHKDFWISSLTKPAAGVVAVVDVAVLELADVLQEHKPTMLMIDIEGAELALLENQELPGVRKVLVELHLDQYGESGIKRPGTSKPTP